MSFQNHAAVLERMRFDQGVMEKNIPSKIARNDDPSSPCMI
jgi:hypothetical protein